MRSANTKRIKVIYSLRSLWSETRRVSSQWVAFQVTLKQLMPSGFSTLSCSCYRTSAWHSSSILTRTERQWRSFLGNLGRFWQEPLLFTLIHSWCWVECSQLILFSVSWSELEESICSRNTQVVIYESCRHSRFSSFSARLSCRCLGMDHNGISWLHITLAYANSTGGEICSLFTIGLDSPTCA